LDSVPAGIGPAVRRFGPSLLRLAAGVTVLWFLGRLVGAAPFEDGLRAVTWPAVVAAVTLTALTTVCSAWRWRVVARALGAGIGLPGAVGAYYRSLFLNSVLPGGVLGDVHRAVTHGRRAGDVVRGLRAVGWERLWGQVIQAVVAVVVLLTLPSPVRPALPYVLAGVAGVGALRAAAGRGWHAPPGPFPLTCVAACWPGTYGRSSHWPRCWSWPGTRPRSSSRPGSPAAPHPWANWSRC
jgi:uncharacterized membrane protein YbhN (UPF0104 family)